MTASFRVSRPIKFLAALVVLCLAAYAAVVVVLGTRWFHDSLERSVVSRLESITGARVELHDLEIKPAIFQIALHGLILHGTESASELALFSADSLVLRVNPVSLLRRKLVISWLDGWGITAHVITRADGSTNIPGSREPLGAAASKLVNLSIGTMVLERSALIWNDERIPLNLAARDSSVLIYRQMSGYRGSLASSSLGLNIRGSALPRAAVSARVELSGGRVDLSELVWRSPGVSAQGSATLAWSSVLHGNGSFEAHGEVGQLAQALGWKPVSGGDFRLRGETAFDTGHLSVTGNVRLARLVVSTPFFHPGPSDLSADFNASAGGINLTHLKVYALGGSFSGSGAVRFAKRAAGPDLRGVSAASNGGLEGVAFSVRGHVDGIDLTKALSSIPRFETLGKLMRLSASLDGDARASWNGNFNDLAAQFSVKATPQVRIPAGARPLVGAARGTVVSRPQLALNIDRAQFATPHSSFTAQGTLGGAGRRYPGAANLLHPISLRFQYSTTNFAEAQPLLDDITGLSKPLPFQVHSEAVFAGVAAGTISDPQIKGQLSVGPFSYGGWTWSGFSGAIEASPEGVAVESGRLRSGPSTFDFSGSATFAGWKVTPQSRLQISARAQGSPLLGLEDALGVRYPFTGLATGEIEVHGNPSTLAGSGSFQVTGGSAYGETFDRLSARLVVAGAKLDLENIVLRKSHGTLAGWLNLDWPARSFAMQFHGSGFSLHELKRITSVVQPGGTPAPATGSFQGTAGIFIEGSGRLSAPSIHATVTIQGLGLASIAAGNLAIELQLASDRLNASASLRGAEGNLDLSIITQTRGAWLTKVSGTFSEFRLDPWLDLAGRGRIGTPIVASGSISGSGPLKEPHQFALRAVASKLAIVIPGFNVTNVQPVEIEYANGSIDSNRFEMRGPSTALEIHLAAQLEKPIRVSLEAHGDAQASLLRLFDPSLQAVGRFSIDLNDSGPVDQPSLSGRIQVEDLSVRYGNLPLPLSGLNGAITLRGNRAVIESLKEQTGQTSIAISGGANLGESPAFDVRAAFQRIRVEYPTGLTSIASGALKLAGTPASAQLTGEVTVDQMFAAEGFNVVNWLGDLGSSLGAPSAPASATFASKVGLNVRILTNPTVRMDSPTLSYVAAIEATLRGTLSQPVATGDIHIRQGQALIAGNRYQITRGDITMTSPYQAAPVLDLEVETRVERYDLTIEITGPADRIKMSYRSDPPLPTEDILSLLALGYAPRQALMSSSGSQNAGVASAGSLLSTALATQTSGRLQRLFGVTRVRIDPNMLGPSTAGGVRVTLEQQVSRNVTATYSTNTGAAQQRDIRLRWDVSDRISLIGERDINGVYGVEVRFRRRLR